MNVDDIYGTLYSPLDGTTGRDLDGYLVVVSTRLKWENDLVDSGVAKLCIGESELAPSDRPVQLLDLVFSAPRLSALVWLFRRTAKLFPAGVLSLLVDVAAGQIPFRVLDLEAAPT